MPVRQYALEKLEQSGDAGDAHRKHAEYFLALAERAELELRGSRQVEWLERLERENDNLRAAMSWALDTGDTETAARLGWALWLFWRFHGHQREGRRWMEVLLERDVPPSLRPRAIHAASLWPTCRVIMKRSHGTRRASEAVPTGGGRALRRLRPVWVGLWQWTAGSSVRRRPASRRPWHSYAGQARTAWCRWCESGSGTVALIQGDHDRALPMFEEGLAQAQQRGDRLGTYNALYNLAQVALGRGDHELATRMLKEGCDPSPSR
jgi:tetratricopeptide (TPR) repeat protein